MELFTLTTMNASDEQMNILFENIQRQLNESISPQLSKKINMFVQGPAIHCFAAPSLIKHKKDKPHVIRLVSDGIAEFVIDEMEQKLISDMIKQRYKNYEQDEVLSIKQYCIEVLNSYSHAGMSDGRQLRKTMLATAFEKYLNEHELLNIDGFIHFRLPVYKIDLSDVVEFAVAEFIMDKQYQEFISLLQYFVYVQDRKVAEVHIIHKEGSDFIILDEKHQVIEKEQSNDFVVEMIDKDLNYEDMIISSLISISPEKVYIHTRAKDLQVIKTIQHIFENRTVLCDDCALCHPVLDKFSLDR